MAVLRTEDGKELILTCRCGCDDGIHFKIDKDFFAYKLTKRGFAEGIMEDKVQYENDRIDKIQKQIRIFEYKISELRRTIQDYI